MIYNGLYKMYNETHMIDNTDAGVVFVVKTESRPDEYPELEFDKMKKYYHIGIIYKGMVYETFDKGRFNKSKFTIEKNRINDDTSVFLTNVEIDLNKLEDELKSGTSCDEYVARVTGISNRSGDDKGDLFPIDVYDKLKNNENVKEIKIDDIM